MSSFYGAFISSCPRTTVPDNVKAKTCEKMKRIHLSLEKRSLYELNEVIANGWDTRSNILYLTKTWCCGIMLYLCVFVMECLHKAQQVMSLQVGQPASRTCLR